jgi:parallel beta-helix repeat protein
LSHESFSGQKGVPIWGFGTKFFIDKREMMKIAKKVIFWVFIIAAQAFGQSTYYVSSVGSDANDGKSTSAPWKTITKVNSVTYASGDVIYFQSGNSFSGQINVNHSGVTIGTYGGSLHPVITGAIQISNWTAYSGSIYVAQASSMVKNLFANGNQMTLARYPDAGFLTIGGTNGSTTITATGLNQASGYWNGSNLRLRTNDYVFDTRTVSSYDGSTITLSSALDYTIAAGNGFYLDNNLNALGAPGEWYCDPNDNKVYFEAPGNIDPNTMTVLGSTFDYGINSSQSNLTIQDLDFKYQAQAALYFSGSTQNTRILSNNIYGAYGYGIFVDGNSSNYTIDGNTIRSVNGDGIYVYISTSTTVKNNTVKNIGMVQGYGKSGTSGMVGITVGGHDNLISGNIVDNIGYIGIELGKGYSYNTIIENNVVSNVMLNLADGGAIYMYGGSANTVRNNIIYNSVGNKDGTTAPDYKKAHGIYLDNETHDVLVEGNTVSHISTSGIFLQYDSYRNTIHNNMFIDCDLDGHGNSLYIIQNANSSTGQHVITQNVFVPTNASQRLVILQEDVMSSSFDSPGVIDNNYYLNPYGNPIPFGTILNKSGGYSWSDYTFAKWQALFSGIGQETNSKYIVPASYQRDTVIINSTASPMTVNLPPVLFLDLDNNSVTGSFTLAPFSSKLLIRDTAHVTSTTIYGTFSVTPKVLPTSGGAVTLQWTSQNATAAVIDNGIGSVELSGTVTVTVTSNTTFKLTLTGPTGSVTYADNVVLTNRPPPTGKLTVPDTLRIASIPGKVTLQWTSQNADSAKIDNSVGKLPTLNGSIEKDIYNTTIYTLTLYGSSGLTATSVGTVIVLNPQLPPTGTFIVTPSVLPLGGGNITLQWTSQNATSASIDNGIGTVQLNGSKTVSVTTNTIFRITLTGQSGSITYVDTVTVSDQPLPTGTFTADQDTVPYNGANITFYWTSQNATSAKISGLIINPAIQLNGHFAEWVYNTSAIKLTLTGPGGSITYVDSVFVRKPPTGTFISDPDTLPINGGYVTLRWTSLNATSAKIDIDNDIRNVKPNDTYGVSAPTSKIFKLTLSGPAGSDTLTASVIVLKQPTGTFTATPDTLPNAPATVKLQWTSEFTTKVSIIPLVGTLNETSGTKSVTVTNNTIFKLTLTGPFGDTATYVDTVIVLKPVAGIRVIGASPLNYALSQNYPNPFNPTTIIEYALPRAGFTTLKIYNSLGEEVSSLIAAYLQPGKYAIEWDASKFASGMYFYRLQTGSFTTTKKLVLIR